MMVSRGGRPNANANRMSDTEAIVARPLAPPPCDPWTAGQAPEAAVSWPLAPEPRIPGGNLHRARKYLERG